MGSKEETKGSIKNEDNGKKRKQQFRIEISFWNQIFKYNNNVIMPLVISINAGVGKVISEQFGYLYRLYWQFTVDSQDAC